MRTVIVEISGKYAAVLSDDGSVSKVKNNNYAIGQVIDMKVEDVIMGRKNPKLIALGAVAAAAVMVCGIGAYGYVTPYSYVSVDVNPSIEYVLNRFDRVLEVKAVNDDGKQIVKEVDIKNLSNKKINDAIQVTLDGLVKDGFLVENSNENLVYIATYGKDQQKADKLAENISKQLSNKEKDKKIVAQAIGKERVEQAKELGVTPGKLNLVEKLQSSAIDPEKVKLEEWLEKSVKEIVKETINNKRNNKDWDDLYDDIYDDLDDLYDDWDDDYDDLYDDDFDDDDDWDDIYDDDRNPNKPNKPANPNKPTKPANPNKPIKDKYDDDDWDDIYDDDDDDWDDDDDDWDDDDRNPNNPNKPSNSNKPANPNKPVKPANPNKPIKDNDDWDDIYDDDYDDNDDWDDDDNDDDDDYDDDDDDD